MATILIVDDDPDIRGTLKALLGRENFRIYCAENGEQGLTKAAELLPDLILLDVMMPGMDGFEVCEQLRAAPETAEIPIIMLTALDDARSRIRGFQLGVDEFISKPFSGLELKTRIRTIARLNRYRALIQERRKFEWVVDHADTGYVMVDCDSRILYANHRARRYLNMPEDSSEFPSPTFRELAARQYQCKPSEAWDGWPYEPGTCGTGDIPILYLVRPESLVSNAFWLEVNTIRISDGSENQYLVRLKDVTESIAGRHLTYSLHNQIGHKLRSPLATLKQCLDILSEISDSDNPDARDFIRCARESAAGLQSELNNIFSYIKSVNMKNAQALCPFSDIARIVPEIAENLKIPSPVFISEPADIEDNLRLRISSAALHQVVWEIFENSRKFHPANTPELEVSILKMADHIRIRISDNGICLAPNQFRRIWEPYYQAEKDITGRTPGTGLGLAMVEAVIWGAGGSCRAFNRQDRDGFVVELTLPLVRSGAELDNLIR